MLFRKGWGQPPRTGVEQTATQERGFRQRWDFLLFVSLDDAPPPDWLPKAGRCFQVFSIYDLELVDLNSATWNLIKTWLTHLQALRNAA